MHHGPDLPCQLGLDVRPVHLCKWLHREVYIGVINQDIDLAEFLFSLDHHIVNSGAVADVGLHRNCFAACSNNAGPDFFSFVF